MPPALFFVSSLDDLAHKAVTAHSGLRRSAWPRRQPGTCAHAVARHVTCMACTCNMNTAGFNRGNRPMQVEEPFGLTTWELDWLQSGVEAGKDEADRCVCKACVNGVLFCSWS